MSNRRLSQSMLTEYDRARLLAELVEIAAERQRRANPVAWMLEREFPVGLFALIMFVTSGMLIAFGLS